MGETKKEKNSLSASETVKKLKDYFNKGVEASKKGLKSAGNAISDFGDKSVLRIELTQLKSKETKLFTDFGQMIYEKLKENKDEAVSLSDKTIKSLFTEIDKNNKEIVKHENLINGEPEKAAARKTDSESKPKPEKNEKPEPKSEDKSKKEKSVKTQAQTKLNTEEKPKKEKSVKQESKPKTSSTKQNQPKEKTEVKEKTEKKPRTAKTEKSEKK